VLLAVIAVCLSIPAAAYARDKNPSKKLRMIEKKPDSLIEKCEFKRHDRPRIYESVITLQNDFEVVQSRVTIKNVGQNDVALPVGMTILRETDDIHPGRIPNTPKNMELRQSKRLAPQESFTSTWKVVKNRTDGRFGYSYVVTWEVDPRNTIRESNELNNSIRCNLVILPRK